jgi:protein pelota
MRAHFDPKHDFARITPQNPADLRLLSLILTPGSLVKTKTLRSVTVRRGIEEKVKAGKREMILTIRTGKVEMEGESLRIGGPIEAGPEQVDLHSWHTLEIEPFEMLEVWREWKCWEMDQIKQATMPPEPVLVCILDERDADIWVVSDKAKHLAHVRGPGLGKKEIHKKPEDYYADIISILQRKTDIRKFLLAGPGFTRENLQKFIKERFRELLPKLLLERTYETGEVGLRELLKAKVLEKIVQGSKLSDETAAVEGLLEEMGRKGPVAYGPEKVKAALEAGSVERLMVVDTSVRGFAALLDLAESSNAAIMIVSGGSDAAEKLEGLGGIASKLKFKV